MIVCLCGSARSIEAYQEANLRELAGKIVLTIDLDIRSDTDLFVDEDEQELEEIKAKLDEFGLRKTDLADEVLILDEYCQFSRAVADLKEAFWAEVRRVLTPVLDRLAAWLDARRGD